MDENIHSFSLVNKHYPNRPTHSAQHTIGITIIPRSPAAAHTVEHNPHAHTTPHTPHAIIASPSSHPSHPSHSAHPRDRHHHIHHTHSLTPHSTHHTSHARLTADPNFARPKGSMASWSRQVSRGGWVALRKVSLDSSHKSCQVRQAYSLGTSSGASLSQKHSVITIDAASRKMERTSMCMIDLLR